MLRASPFPLRRRGEWGDGNERTAELLALWTGQRQGDLLRLPWSAYDGARIRLQQSAVLT
jgi:hypothetical protein